jgi:hypothetical protein
MILEIYYFLFLKMTTIFKNFLNDNSKAEKNGTHIIYVVPFNVYIQLQSCIKRWEFNRPADEERVKDIYEYMKTSQRMDGMLYLAVVNDEIICYDGNHRREALNCLILTNPNNTMNSIFIDMLWEADNKLIGNEFKRINSSVSVPEFYYALDTTDKVQTKTRESIKRMIDSFCEKYKEHKSPSRNPHRPSFNRDVFSDDFYKTMNEMSLTANELMDKLMILNHQLSLKSREKLTEKIITKCNRSGLWLFAWSSRIKLD